MGLFIQDEYSSERNFSNALGLRKTGAKCSGINFDKTINLHGCFRAGIFCETG
jgi:hypothetical protein